MSTTLNNRLATSHDDEPDILINALRTWGINYLISETDADQHSAVLLSPVELMKCLARCEAPRVRDASISLFLLHPELSPHVLEALQTSEPPAAEQLAVLILAALYLQRLWSFRLTIALGHTARFPEQPFAHLWQDRQLPPPAYQYGKPGLRMLQATEQERRGLLPLDFIGDWQNQIDHLLQQEEARQQQLIVPKGLLEVQDEKEEQGYNEMSMRHNVTRTDIERFLNALGKAFRKPGRLYLAGGAALVHLGLRSGSTVDIDIVIETPDEDEMITVIRRLVDSLQMNIEFSSPADFIPIPSQWKAHARYIGRYGSIDAFYFDFYSLALSKIARGNERDLIDVKLLVQRKIIALEGLDAAYQEILPRMGKRPYLNLAPQRFAERYATIRQQLQELSTER